MSLRLVCLQVRKGARYFLAPLRLLLYEVLQCRRDGNLNRGIKPVGA